MIIAVINILFWIVILIKDVKEYINIRRVWGKGYGHKTFIIVDTLCLLFSLFLVMKML